MNRDDVLYVLSRSKPELQKLGVRHVGLFGSVVRGQPKAGSDIDILVDLDATAEIGVYEYAGIIEYLQTLFTSPVDVANAKALKAAIRPQIEREVVYAF